MNNLDTVRHNLLAPSGISDGDIVRVLGDMLGHRRLRHAQAGGGGGKAPLAHDIGKGHELMVIGAHVAPLSGAAIDAISFTNMTSQK